MACPSDYGCRAKLCLSASRLAQNSGVKISADRWPDHVRLSDIESLFVCKACGAKGADVRPDFHWDEKTPARKPHTPA
jgi:hypothetical protein